MKFSRKVTQSSKESLIALLFDFFGIFAGWIVSHLIPLLEASPWILVMYPMILTVRGNLSGVFSGNLSTLLNVGLIKPRLRGNTDTYYSLVSSIFTLSIVMGALIGFLTFLISSLIHGIPIGQLILIVSASISTGVLSLYLTAPITTLIGASSFRLGLDPDVIVYPLMSTITDLLASCCFTLVIFLFEFISYGFSFSPMLAMLILLIPILPLILRGIKTNLYFKLIKETTPLIILLVFIANLTGAILSSLMNLISRNPAILVVFPVLADMIGDIGAIIGSISTTKLVLGFLKPRISSVTEMLPEILGVECSALLITAFCGLVSVLVSNPSLPNVLNTMLMVSLSNLMCFPIIAVISLITAMFTFRHGWNPDNFVIPIETTISDLLTATSLALIGLI